MFTFIPQTTTIIMKLTSLLIFFITLIPSLQAQVEEMMEPNYIRTVQFSGNTNQSQLPIIELGERLQLNFDALNTYEEDYYYTITHYDYDWTPSDLSKAEYLNGFDDVRIETYENSLNTLQLFSNYRLRIPNRETRAITKSGNYLISIFNDNNDLIFSRKFMVIERLASVGVEIRRSRDLDYIEEKQVVNFVVSSANPILINPEQTVNVMILQNSNLNTAITNIKPQYTLGNELIYRYDQETAFWAGNEFLAFDNKDERAAVTGIRRIELNDIYENFLFTDISRFNRPYTFNPDINGNFVVRNIDAIDSSIEAEYVRMHFNLQYFEDIGDKEIHIYGAFNNWRIDGTTYLEYDEKSDTYRCSRLFKQGFYNYKYVLVDRDGSIDQGAIGGNFWQTENEYTVLVYFKALGARFDRIIGIGQTNSTLITNN